MSEDNPTADQIAVEDTNDGKLEKNLKSRTVWLRLLFMCIYAMFASLAGMVGSAVIVLGFLWLLFTGEANRELRQVGQAIATYLFEIIRYLTMNTDAKPFPFGTAWPSGESQD